MGIATVHSPTATHCGEDLQYRNTFMKRGKACFCCTLESIIASTICCENLLSFVTRMVEVIQACLCEIALASLMNIDK